MCDAEALPSSGVNTTTIGGSASSSNVVFIVIWKSIAAGGGGSARVRANDGAGTEAGHVRSTSRVTSPVPFGNQKQNWRVRSLISSLRAAQVPRRSWSEWSARVEKALPWRSTSRPPRRSPWFDAGRARPSGIRHAREGPDGGFPSVEARECAPTACVGSQEVKTGKAAAVLFYGGSPIST